MYFSNLRFVLLLILLNSASATAQKAEISLVNNQIIAGVLNTDKLLNSGIVEIDIDSELWIYEAEEVQAITFSDGRVIFSKKIIVTDANFNESVNQYFAESIISGPVSLWQVYSQEFSFALEKYDELMALQIITEKTLGGTNKTIAYHSVLFQYSSDCMEDLNSHKVGLTRSQLIVFVNQYNQCVETNYVAQLQDQVEYRVFELIAEYGNVYSELTFSAERLYVNEEINYKINYRTSVTNYFSGLIQSFIYNDNISIGVGLQFNEYKFEPALTEELISGTSFEFSEMVFSGRVGFQYSINKIIPAVKFGYNLHSISKDYDKSISVRVRQNPNDNFTNTVILKDSKRELSSNYSTFSLSPSLSYRIREVLELGLIYNLYTNNKNFLSMKRNDTVDTITNSSIGVFLKLRFKTVK